MGDKVVKQHITYEQIEELTDNQLDKLTNWYNNSQKNSGLVSLLLPFLSIGQMIELLDERMPISVIGHQSQWHGGMWYWNGGAIPNEPLTESNLEKSLKSYQSPELCDALWEAVKEVLGAK